MLGLFSDTHGNRQRSRMVMEQFLARGCEVIVHCGDVGSEEILFDLVERFLPRNLPVYVVSGNVDLFDSGVLGFPESTGIAVRRTHRFAWADFSCGVIHGDDPRTLQAWIDSGEFDWIFTGHTHVAAMDVVGPTRILNPGAVHRSPRPGYALVEPSGAFSFHAIPL